MVLPTLYMVEVMGQGDIFVPCPLPALQGKQRQSILTVRSKAMLVITGIFENGRFIPDKPVSIPERKKVSVTIDDETPAQWSIEERIAAAERLAGVASNDPMTLEEIRNERLARQ